MKKPIKPPFLSTSFSESGRNAKRRFANILNTRRRKAGAVIIAAAVLAVGIGGTAIAFRAQENRTEAEDGVNYREKAFVRQLIDSGHPYVGDMPANSKTADLLGISDRFGGFTNELQTREEPYGWRLNFKENRYEAFSAAADNYMNGYAAVLMALIDNLNYVEWTFPGTAEVGRLTADEASDLTGVDIKSAAGTKEELKSLLQKMGLWRIKYEMSMPSGTELLTYMEANDLVLGQEQVIRPEKLNEFLMRLSKGYPADIDIVLYNKDVPGSPNVMQLAYDGDSFSGSEYNHYGPMFSSYWNPYGPYKHLKIFKDGNVAYFYLVNDPELTLREIFEYSLSSRIYENPPEFQQLFFIEEENPYEEAVY